MQGERAVLLGHQREGLGADGRAGYQADGDASQRSGVVDAHHRLENRADGVDVRLLAAGIPDPRVQDVPPVQDQDEHVDFGGLQTLLGRSLLTKEMMGGGGVVGVQRCLQSVGNGEQRALAFSVLFFSDSHGDVRRTNLHSTRTKQTTTLRQKPPQLHDQNTGAEHTCGYTHGIGRREEKHGRRWGGEGGVGAVSTGYV